MLQIQQIAYHRNGVGGNGFHAVLFRCDPKGEYAEQAGPLFVASVFSERGSVSVLRVGDLFDAETGITFGENSWRGDHFETSLREAIREYTIKRDMEVYGRSRDEAEAAVSEDEREQEQEQAIVSGAVRAWRESGHPQTAPEPTAPKRARRRRKS